MTPPRLQVSASAAILSSPGIDLYWLPLGAGGHVVKWNGRMYESISALTHRRARAELYHSALIVSLPPESWVIEMTPAFKGGDHGVVAEGAVGTRWARRIRLFRYEVRATPGGTIEDVARAVGSPVHLTSDPAMCRRLLSLIDDVPTPVWGRDEMHTGEMWNSNSTTSWVLERSGVNAARIDPPSGGRAPGWHAGVEVARTSGWRAARRHRVPAVSIAAANEPHHTDDAGHR